MYLLGRTEIMLLMCIRQERQVPGKLVIEFITVVMNSYSWLTRKVYSYEYTYVIMNIISGFSPTKIANNLAKLLTNVSTVT